MKITRLDRSQSGRGGWLVETTAAHSTMQWLLHFCVTRDEARHVRVGVWWIAEQSLDAFGKHFSNFAQMCEKAGRQIPGGKQEQHQQQSAPPPSATDPYATLFLRNNAPSAIVNAVYRALAKHYHPDNGGNHEQMKNLNLAYEQIMKEERRAGWVREHK